MSKGKTIAAAGEPALVMSIGTRWIKAARVRRTRKGIALSGLVCRELKDTGPDLTAGLSEIVRRLGGNRLPVIACLPRQAVNIRMLELPSVEPGEIADMVDLQAGKQTPYSKDEIVSDYRMMPSERPGYCRIMLAIAQRSLLRLVFGALEEAGIERVKVSVSTEGIVNWYNRVFPQNGGEERVDVLLEVDSYYTDFCVVAGGRLLFTRTILTGSERLTGEYGAVKDGYLKEIRHLLEVYRGESGGREPNGIVLSGCALGIKALADDIGSELGLAVQVCDPVDALGSKPESAGAGASGVSITALVGMATDPERLELDMVPESVALRRGLAAKARRLAALGILIMANMVALSMYTTVKYAFMRDALGAIERELESTESDFRQVTEEMEVVSLGMERGDAGGAMVNLMGGVHASLPAGDEVRLASVDIGRQQGGLQIEGISKSRSGIRELVRNLELSPLFGNIKAERVTSDQRQAGYSRFRIVGDVERK